MHTRARRLCLPISLTLILLVAACAPADPSTSPPAPIGSAGTPSEATPSDASAPGGTQAGRTQTESGWGRIWDGVPAGFPKFPGSTIADPISPDPVSATYSVANDDTAQIAVWMQSSLELATFSTESLSGPLEDGGFVLELVGEGDCRIQTSVQPLGGVTFVIVRYGAACPPG